jgi:hypothetical protein
VQHFQFVFDILRFMASPLTPSDSPKPEQADAAKHEGNHTNLLDIWSDVKKNALAPAYNSMAIEPLNVAGNIVNGVSDAGTWALNKLSGSNHQALQVGKAHEMEVGKVEKNSWGSWSQQICGTAGSFLAYAVAGKVAGRAMRVGGDLMPAELAINDLRLGVAVRSVAQDQRAATIIGATAYAGLKDPKEGESRASNMTSTFVGFSFYEAGNSYFVNPKGSALLRLGQRSAVGFAGGAAQGDIASLVQTGKPADLGANFSSGIAGGVLNALMPTGRHIVDSAVENPLFKSVPHVTEATGRLYSDAAQSLPPTQSVLRGSWADPKAVQAVNRMALYDLKTRLNVKLGTETSAPLAVKFSLAADSGHAMDQSPGKSAQLKPDQIWIDQKANVIHTSAEGSPRDVIHELAHRRIFKDPKYEKQFQSHASELVSFDPADPRNTPVKEKYINTRLDQEIAARTVENREAASMGDRAQVSIDRTQIRDQEGYGARLEREADDFVRSGGKARPEADFSPGASALRSSYEPAATETVNPVTMNGVARRVGDTAGGAEAARDGLAIVAGTEAPAAREARIAQITKWDRNSNQIIRSSVDPKDKPQNNLYAVVRERLQATGLTRDGWMVLPTETGSPLDQVGCDYALINARKNQVIFLDATQNQAKLNNPGANNVSEIRAPGLIGFESRWIDMTGRLKIDEDGMLGINAREFQDGLDSQLKHLTADGSPITVEMLPSYSRQPTAQATQAEVDNFRTAVLKRSAQYEQGSYDRQQLEGFARDIQKGAAKYNEFKVATKPSPELSGAMQRNADKVVLDYALTKLNIKEKAEPPRVATTNVKMTKDGHMVMSVDNTIYDGGDVKESLTEARHSLKSDSKKLEALLQKDKAVQNRMKRDNLTLPQMMKIVQEELMSAREVDNGLLGTRNIGLDEALRNRLALQRLDDVVAGRAPAATEKPATAALDASAKTPDRPGSKPANDVRPAAFTPEQQAEIPQMAALMSEFGLSIKDGVSPDEFRTFIQMYSESANTPVARQLAKDYLAEADKPIAQQRLVPKLHGALIESQMRLQLHLGSAEGGPNADGSNVGSAADEIARQVSATENISAQEVGLPFEQVKVTLDRLHELQSRKNLTPDEQFQLEALKAFKSHIMDTSAREAVATNARTIATAARLGGSALP